MLYIIRHGQTVMNHAKALQGRSDHPLNETGEQQAKEAGAWFRDQGIRFDHIYSSPLIRAVQTAKLIAETIAGAGDSADPADLAGPTDPADLAARALGDIRIDDRLIEMDYGPYEGMSLENPAPEVLTFFSDFTNNPAPAGMEPLPDVVSRLGEFLLGIREEAGEGNVLISTHAIAMKGALEYLTPESNGAYWSKYIGNCAIYASDVRSGSFSIPEEIFYQ